MNTGDLLFDTADRRLLHDYFSETERKILTASELRFSSHMHPRGIKELLEPQQFRLAKSVLFLLTMLEKNSAGNRLSALHSMRDELLFCSNGGMVKNTARILPEIMKKLVETGDPGKKLELLHDFNAVRTGNPRLVRKYLRYYGLLEMPESWNQISFDFHVHDSFTKGRRTPTHLVLDAWVKGIRRLTVIYYEFPLPLAVHELLTAARYMNIETNIGIELAGSFRGKFVNLIWEPANINDTEDYIRFLGRPDVKKLSDCMKKSADYKRCAATGHDGRNSRPESFSPDSILERLDAIVPDSRVTLNLKDLSEQDILELLYDCRGKITDLEIYNARNSAEGRMPDSTKIRKLELCLNQRDVPKLKRLIKKNFLVHLEADKDFIQYKKMETILENANQLLEFYRSRKLYERWGSDSAGGEDTDTMGFALLETLPREAQNEVLRQRGSRLLPVRIKTYYRKTYEDEQVSNLRIPLLPLKFRLQKRTEEWVPYHYSSSNPEKNNLVRLSIRRGPVADGPEQKKGFRYFCTYMPTAQKNLLKAAAGFVTAFISFYLTKNWWVLAWLGAPIWIAITGIRNILQAVVGGDSLKRSHLLHWGSYIDWSRIADSVMYSGFSVPLLDFLVKNFMLNRLLGVNMETDPVMVYAVMSLVNGFYISAHNILRGFSRGVIIGNFFRSIISIPVAFVFSSAAGELLSFSGIEDTAAILQKWAAIISKFSSDLVGGIIEGAALRRRNTGLRQQDYDRKIEQFLKTCGEVELLYPRKNVLKQLKQNRNILQDLEKDDPKLLKILVYDCLDLLYFWEYQPCARPVLRQKILRMPERTREMFLQYQRLLLDKTEICRLLKQGIVGIHYRPVLNLYKNKYAVYMAALGQKMVSRH
jgi:hypothetical protein